MAGAGRRKVLVYMIFIVVVFGTFGLVAFQMLKERKNSGILVVAKDREIEKLSDRYEELLDATKKTLSLAKEEKNDLSRRVQDLENNNMQCLTSSKHEQEKCENNKDREVRALQKMLEAKETEITSKRAELKQYIEIQPFRKKVDIEHVVKRTGNNDSLEALDSINARTKDAGEDSVSRRATQVEEKIDDAESRVEDRNAATEAEIKEAKTDTDFEAGKTSVANLESELEAARVVGGEDDIEKELEADMRLAASDELLETNDSLAQD